MDERYGDEGIMPIPTEHGLVQPQTRRPSPRSPFPEGSEGSISRLRQDAFRLAGITPETVARQLVEAMRVVNEAMNATKEVRIYRLGQLQESYQEVDHQARLAGVRALGDLTGVSATRASMQGGSGPAQITVALNCEFINQLDREKEVGNAE